MINDYLCEGRFPQPTPTVSESQRISTHRPVRNVRKKLAVLMIEIKAEKREERTRAHKKRAATTVALQSFFAHEYISRAVFIAFSEQVSASVILP